MKPLLEKLGIQEVNPGACTGPDSWIEDPNGKELVSYNPTTGEPLATVIKATDETSQQVIAEANNAFQTCTTWGMRCARSKNLWVNWSPWRWGKSALKVLVKCRR